ncbi:hypothetical protein UNDYM_1920 [Undibacterium sp. YM2]|uniref:phage tail protein n=1 Tax=Undibacterium sp. YM2 TaxID=2058625 RepID=UPI001331D9D7|nr:phage tail protein [Undibacterium sp. YM2]BBB66173.1 hypothetical protein UNDYM_1920 [Undibacterium sp. YM2]
MTKSRSFKATAPHNTDYSDEEDALIVPLLDWLATRQADLFGNDDKAKGIRFMVDFNNRNSGDITVWRLG